MLVTFVTGSVHAFSVFVVPLESLLNLPRSEISLIYSLALVSITVSVLFGYRIYSLVASWWLILSACFIAAAGLYIASIMTGWWVLFVGYSLLFGISNGIGYGYTLQLVGREMPEIKGFAMGAVTAAYAVGSIVFAKIFALRIATSSVSAAFISLAIGLVICGVIAALIMRITGASYSVEKNAQDQPKPSIDHRRVARYWLAYMCSVFAGLMAIGHAAGIAISKNASIEVSTLSAMMIGIGSASGGFLAGWLVDRWPAKWFLVGLPILSAIALVVTSVVEQATTVVALLTLVGFSYGSVIAIYPVVISNDFAEMGARIYGRIFTAWGFAGLVAPWTAGLIFDWKAGYDLALIVAAATAVVSALVAASIKLKN